MKKNIFLFISLLFCFSCQQNSTPTPFSGSPKYQTTDPARLYFNNIRSIAYYKTRKPPSEIDIYQLKKKAQAVDRPIIHPIIVDNWLANEAYLFLEKNDFRQFFAPLTIKIEQDTSNPIFEIDVFNKSNQYDFAATIYEALKARQTITVKDKEGQFIPILENYQDKSNFMITMTDYFRLIDVDRKRK
ncbi:MAG: hypothetical protein AB8G86_09950 [Saprospiraceae bacterium]